MAKLTRVFIISLLLFSGVPALAQPAAPYVEIGSFTLEDRAQFESLRSLKFAQLVGRGQVSIKTEITDKAGKVIAQSVKTGSVRNRAVVKISLADRTANKLEAGSMVLMSAKVLSGAVTITPLTMVFQDPKKKPKITIEEEYECTDKKGVKELKWSKGESDIDGNADKAQKLALGQSIKDAQKRFKGCKPTGKMRTNNQSTPYWIKIGYEEKGYQGEYVTTKAEQADFEKKLKDKKGKIVIHAGEVVP